MKLIIRVQITIQSNFLSKLLPSSNVILLNAVLVCSDPWVVLLLLHIQLVKKQSCVYMLCLKYLPVLSVVLKYDNRYLFFIYFYFSHCLCSTSARASLYFWNYFQDEQGSLINFNSTIHFFTYFCGSPFQETMSGSHVGDKIFSASWKLNVAQ